MGNVSSADILAGLKTDHSPITLNISLHSNPKGRGFWKLNTSFLTDTDYIDMIKLSIRHRKNIEMMIQSTHLREKSISYAIGKKRQTVIKEFQRIGLWTNLHISKIVT